MTVLETTGTFLRGWTDSAAAAIIAGSDRVASPRLVRLIEQHDGAFSFDRKDKSGNASQGAVLADGVLRGPGLEEVVKGSRVEIVLQPRHFLYRQIELPTRASDFLNGIVRAQIDRLTPWNADAAVFGCSPPVASGPDTITTVVVATTRKAVAVYAQALAACHPKAVVICAAPNEQMTGQVKIFEQQARRHLDANRLGRLLTGLLAAAAIAAVLTTGAAVYVAEALGSKQDDVARQISQQRALIRAGSGDGDRSASASLERRKHELPASVIVLEALTQALPDHTYVTELSLVGNRLQIVGITRDAPSLIPLLEQSAMFTRATFYAPTTRSSSDAGERFHIEARIQAGPG